VICKTLSLDSSKVVNVTPRYAKLKAAGSREVIGWQNIELISDRPFETMLAELKQLKEEYPNRSVTGGICSMTLSGSSDIYQQAFSAYLN
jgi:dihydropyrimidine dehydrogenase (NADP+)